MVLITRHAVIVVDRRPLCGSAASHPAGNRRML
jgi:hypothetical protein